MKLGPLSPVPQMMIKPVALDAVTDEIADFAIGSRTGTFYELAGPEVTTLWDMTKQLPDKIPVPMPIPGRMGRAFRDGALVPGRGPEVIGPNFSEWLNAKAG